MSIFVAPISSKSSRPTRSSETHESGTKSTVYVAPQVDVLEEDEEEADEDGSIVDEEEDYGRDNPVRPNASSPNTKHRSLRHQHLNVLVTLLHKSVLDADWPRAERAYGLLLRSKGVDIRLCYSIGLQILNHTDLTGARSIEFVNRLFIAYPPLKGKSRYDRGDVFVRILTDLRIKHQQYRLALQELEGWLLIPPYKDDNVLWSSLITICKVLEEEAMKSKDMLESHRLLTRRLTAEAKIRGTDARDEVIQ